MNNDSKHDILELYLSYFTTEHFVRVYSDGNCSVSFKKNGNHLAMEGSFSYVFDVVKYFNNLYEEE